MQPEAAIPADLIELKARLEAWRVNRKYEREPLTHELRQAALEMSQRYPPSLVRRILKLDPWRLKKPAAKRPARIPSKPQTAFFTLPPETTLPDLGSSASPTAAGCRLQLERPDGARLTLTLTAFDLTSTRQLRRRFPARRKSMTQLVPQLRILLACQPVDFRNGIDGLAALCKRELAEDSFSGTLYVFRGRGARQHSSTGKPCHHWSGSHVLTLPKSEGLPPQMGIERSLKGTRARGEG